MGHNEGLRERRANAEAVQRSFAALSERALPIMNGHKSSLSSVGTNDTSGTDADTAARSTDSPEQVYRSVPRSSQVPPETRSSSEPRHPSNVRNILN